MQFTGTPQSAQPQDQNAARVLYEHEQFANRLIRYAQQVFGAVGVRQLYVEIYYTTDNTVTEASLNHNSHHHNVNETQGQYNHADTNSLLGQQNQQFQNFNNIIPQQQQYVNPLLMM